MLDVTNEHPFPDNEDASAGNQVGKQPSDEPIHHWYAINGFYAYDAGSYFADPGWGAGSISQDTSHKVVYATEGKGYAW